MKKFGHKEKKLSDIKSLAGKGAWVMMQRSFRQNISDEKALELAAEINSAGPLGVQAIRFTVNEGIADEIEKIVKWELSEQDRLRETADFKEGIKASLERKEPNFRGS